MFGGNFAPRSWAFCDGQLLPIAQNSALFSLLGTTFGGDGRTTFGLPDLRGRIAMHAGAGPGLQDHRLGTKGGAASHTLTAAQMPAHTHEVKPKCNAEGADTDDPSNKFPGVANENIYHGTADSTMLATPSSSAGGGQSFSIQNPYLTINFLIALQGVYPSRS